MKEIIVLEELIRENNNRIKLFRKHLSDHENGENTLSKVVVASTETSLEKANNKVRSYKEMLDEISLHDIFSDKEKTLILEGISRKKTYDNFLGKLHENTDSILDTDKKLEVLKVMDELSSELELDDNKLFSIASRSLSLDDEEKTSLEEKLSSITKNFNEHLKKVDSIFVKKVSSFNFKIPVLILHFWILVESLKNTYEKLNKEFRGFPKYEDWWISELWTSHHAYYGVYKLREIITLQCLTIEQKQSWEKIFDNWLSIKLYLHSKGSLAYEYMLIFDKMVSNFAGFEEELAEDNLKSMDILIKNKILKEDFTKVGQNHTSITSYMRFKKKEELKKVIDKK